MLTWASADFFPGEGKNILFAYKTPKNILFSSKKVKNILFWPPRGPGGGVKGPLLPSPARCQKYS